jgi:hypothetical protein
MSAMPDTPAAAGDPMGFVGYVPRMVFRGKDDDVHEIALVEGAWRHSNLSMHPRRPSARTAVQLAA